MKASNNYILLISLYNYTFLCIIYVVTYSIYVNFLIYNQIVSYCDHMCHFQHNKCVSYSNFTCIMVYLLTKYHSHSSSDPLVNAIKYRFFVEAMFLFCILQNVTLSKAAYFSHIILSGAIASHTSEVRTNSMC
jgi:hypothetical protein